MKNYNKLYKQIIYYIIMQKFNEHKFMEIFGETTFTTEKFIDLLVHNGRVYKRYYSKINQLPRDDINNLISKLVVEDNYVIDRTFNNSIELVDYKTGKIRYTIWNNNSVEKYFVEDLGLVKHENYLL